MIFVSIHWDGRLVAGDRAAKFSSNHLNLKFGYQVMKMALDF
jgi:hypothetical protein